MSRISEPRNPRLPPRALSTLETALLPLLRAGILARRMKTLQGLHPHDAPRGHAAGYDPDKILMVGSGPAFGWGVMSHELSLAGALARATSAMTGRGCDVEVVTKADLVASQVDELIGERHRDGYDAIVFVLGIQDAIRGTSAASWRSSISGMIESALSSTTAMTDIFFVGMPLIRSITIYDSFLGGVAEQQGLIFNDITAQLCAAEERVFYQALPQQPLKLVTTDRHRTSAQYDAWAAVIAPTLAHQLNAKISIEGDRRKSCSEIDEALRQRTVDALPVTDITQNETLQKLVELAHKAFRAETAQLTLVDERRQLPLLSAGIDLPEVPREQSFCSIALQQREPLVVRDAAADERFRDNPLVTGEPHIRFYAGIPITAPSGERIGALCVIDSHPRLRRDDINLDYLRELCVLAEKELWKIVSVGESDDPGTLDDPSGSA